MARKNAKTATERRLAALVAETRLLRAEIRIAQIRISALKAAAR